ncbi:MAG: DUF5916 domain-containing protein [Gemmatimonadales bacterium]
MPPLALLLLQLAVETTPQRPTVVPPRIDTVIGVDGKLDEPVWRQAVRLGGFHQYRPVDLRPADQQTEVLVWYSPTAIHFGIIAHDRDPGAIRATLADRDKIDEDDRVILYLDTFNDRRRAFAFGVNALGVQEDGVRTEGSGGGGGGGGGGSRGGGGGGGGGGFGTAVSFDRSQDYVYTSRGSITDSGYVVEVQIPFKSLRYPGGRELTWGFHVVRATQRSGFEDTWADVRRGSSSFLGQSGLITGLTGIKRGLVTEVQPFVTAAASGIRDTLGRFERQRLDPDFGANFRLGFTSLAIDGTINPDFSQVESDAGQVTLNERFALFFPERRPFFLEGIELFQTPGSLVYTRRVGNPIAGGKITGKFGRFGVAHLTAVDDVTDEDSGIRERPLVNIARLRADVGQNSLAGVTFTDRSTGRGYSRIIATDSRFVIKRIYTLNTSVGRSFASDTVSRAGSIWSVDFGRTGRSFGFSYSFEGRSPDFEAALGYVPRVGDVNLRIFNRYSIFGKPGALFEGITFFAGLNRYWDYQGFGTAGAVEGEQSLSGFGRLRGGWSYGFSTRLGFVDFDPAFYDGAQVLVGGQLTTYRGPAQLKNAGELQVNISTPNLSQGSATVRVSRRETAIFAEAAEGRELSISGSAEVRPHGWIRAEATGTYSRLTRRRDGSEYGRTILPRLRVELQPNRFFFFRVIGEYRSERRDARRDARTGAVLYFDGTASTPATTNRVRIDALLAYQPSPGTVVFVGYGAGYAGDRTLTFQRLLRQEDGFFLKLAYQIRT